MLVRALASGLTSLTSFQHSSFLHPRYMSFFPLLNSEACNSPVDEIVTLTSFSHT
jgi:hypothetical protein